MAYMPLAALVSILALAHYLAVSRRQGILTMDGIFVLTQWLMSVGTFALLDQSEAADRAYGNIILAAMALYVTFSTLTHWILRAFNGQPSLARNYVVSIYRPTKGILALLLLAIGITIAYFIAVGYNTFALGIRNLFTGATADYTTLRLEAYGGARYLFPGYVNQFKNAILPALTVVIAIYLFKTRHTLRKPITVPLVALSILGILGTGQRGAFIQFGLTLLTFLYFFDRRRFPKRATVAAAALAPLLLISTFLLGRSSTSLAQQGGLLSTVGTLSEELLRRAFRDNQFSAKMGFRYIHQQPSQDGGEWVTAVLGILPGNPGSPLARQLFQNLYGTDRGTAPPSLWGSVYYNFGWHGIVLVPILLAIAYQLISFSATRKYDLNSLELIGMSGTFVVFGNWAAGGPEYLLNAGGVTFSLLWLLGRHARTHPLRPNPSSTQMHESIPAGVMHGQPRKEAADDRIRKTDSTIAGAYSER